MDCLLILYVISLLLTLALKIGQRFAMKASSEPLAALDGLAQEAASSPIVFWSVFVPDPAAHIPKLPVHNEVRLQYPGSR